MTEETLDRRVMPPSRIIRTRTVISAPVTQVGTEKVFFRAEQMAFAYVMYPKPNDAMTAKIANSMARTAPTVLFLKPRFIVVIGPPSISP